MSLLRAGRLRLRVACGRVARPPSASERLADVSLAWPAPCRPLTSGLRSCGSPPVRLWAPAGSLPAPSRPPANDLRACGSPHARLWVACGRAARLTPACGWPAVVRLASRPPVGICGRSPLHPARPLASGLHLYGSLGSLACRRLARGLPPRPACRFARIPPPRPLACAMMGCGDTAGPVPTARGGGPFCVRDGRRVCRRAAARAGGVSWTSMRLRRSAGRSTRGRSGVRARGSSCRARPSAARCARLSARWAPPCSCAGPPGWSPPSSRG